MLCLVERRDRLAEAGHAQVGGIEAQLGGGHLGQQLFRVRAAPGARSGGVNSFQQVHAGSLPCVCDMSAGELEEGQLVLGVVNHQLHHVPGSSEDDYKSLSTFWETLHPFSEVLSKSADYCH